jgi:hypothetical protein
MDEEIKQKFAEIEAALEELYGFFGRLSPKAAAMRPSYLKSGDDGYEAIGGLIRAKAPKVAP